jgi:hypothetical protein
MTEFVTVCCKLPMGLVIEIDELHHEIPALGGGTKEVPTWKPSGRKITLNGANAANPRSPNPGRAVAGYGLTEVPKDFWDEWVEQHKGFGPLTNGSLFAQPTADRAQGQMREHEGVQTGLERLDPTKPGPRLSRATSGSL